jgi:GNAT superfamily N-acetyltransferase
MVEITDFLADDIEPILDVVRRTGFFTDDEVQVAREVLDEAALGPDRTTYRALTARVEGRVAGYIHYGETPMTQGCYDLYWMAVDPDLQGRGIGAKLVRAMEDRIRASGARLVRVETSGLAEYAPTRAFYERIGYPESSRIRDFYWAGNDLCTHVRYL